MHDTRYCSVFNTDASETIAYNNPLFPAYIRYGMLSHYPDYSAVSHWHRDLEFILVKKGRMTYNVNGELIELTENNGLMVNSRQLHYGFSAEHHECEFICIILSPELLQGNRWFYENYIERITEHPAYPYQYLSHNDWTKNILERLDKMYLSFGSGNPTTETYFTLIEDFIYILRVLYVNFNMEQTVKKENAVELAVLRSMISYIEDHYMERITLENIAQSGACCKSRCSLLFKKYLCDTPITYTTKLRLRKSLPALLESDRSITDIAYEYGFGGASYYCETFKKYYGVPPLTYRKIQADSIFPALP
ncbi:MAG: AraC family transcriptional regulator [Lachnospiraceae bacterium]|nr:AraC family transcriptional regulator [Lachnospiraceae bacterium]